MKNEGCLVATERAPKRVVQLAQTCLKLDCKCVRIAQADASKLVFSNSKDCNKKSKRVKLTPTSPSELSTLFIFIILFRASQYLNSDNNLSHPQFSPSTFDRILVDAPCSGIGIRPTLIPDELAGNDLASRPNMQQHILSSGYLFFITLCLVWPLLKNNGTLVYSTCTLNPNEGECVVKWALDNLEGAELVRPFDSMFDDETRKLHNLNGEHVRHNIINEELEKKIVRFDPSKDHNNPAFFMAKFVKK